MVGQRLLPIPVTQRKLPLVVGVVLEGFRDCFVRYSDAAITQSGRIQGPACWFQDLKAGPGEDGDLFRNWGNAVKAKAPKDVPPVEGGALAGGRVNVAVFRLCWVDHPQELKRFRPRWDVNKNLELKVGTRLLATTLGVEDTLEQSPLLPLVGDPRWARPPLPLEILTQQCMQADNDRFDKAVGQTGGFGGARSREAKTYSVQPSGSWDGGNGEDLLEEVRWGVLLAARWDEVGSEVDRVGQPVALQQVQDVGLQ
jgi:hypothetical protein